MKIKVCGMRYNPGEVAALQPDYLGFIFWEKSPRYFDGKMPILPPELKKVGVFVDEQLDKVVDMVSRFRLDAVQLHGEESANYCAQLRKKLEGLDIQTEAQQHSKKDSAIEIIKVFSIRDSFDFTVLAPFEEYCDYYLFDTKGKLPGGNGYAFNWEVLKDYPSTKPYFLSGGIGLDNVSAIEAFLQRPESKYCYALDVNSKFEDKAGLKNIDRIQQFKKLLHHELSR